MLVEDIPKEEDGSTLLHDIQKLYNQTIILPRNKSSGLIRKGLKSGIKSSKNWGKSEYNKSLVTERKDVKSFRIPQNITSVKQVDIFNG